MALLNTAGVPKQNHQALLFQRHGILALIITMIMMRPYNPGLILFFLASAVNIWFCHIFLKSCAAQRPKAMDPPTPVLQPPKL